MSVVRFTLKIHHRNMNQQAIFQPAFRAQGELPPFPLRIPHVSVQFTARKLIRRDLDTRWRAWGAVAEPHIHRFGYRSVDGHPLLNWQ